MGVTMGTDRSGKTAAMAEKIDRMVGDGKRVLVMTLDGAFDGVGWLALRNGEPSPLDRWADDGGRA